METEEYTTAKKLERYSFLYSELRLIVAAVALGIGGVPPVMYVAVMLPMLSMFIATLLSLAQILAGLASAYLVFRWQQHGWQVFGGKQQADQLAFFVSTFSGIHLGIAGLAGVNIGMQFTMSYVVFAVAALAYVISAWYLYKRWKEEGERLF
jgi:hypothetical protein